MLRRSEWRRSFLCKRRRSKRTPRAIARAAQIRAASVGKSRAAVLRRSEWRRSFLCKRRRSRRTPRAIARAAQIRAASVGKSRAAVLRRSEWRRSFLCKRRRSRRTRRAQDRARRCPGRTNEQTRISSASARGRQRLTKRDPRERSEQSDLARAAHTKNRPGSRVLISTAPDTARMKATTPRMMDSTR